MTSGEVMAQGGIEKIGLPGAFLKLTDKEGKKVVIERESPGHQQGIEFILSVLTDATYGCIKDYKEIDAVGHRLVHGGEKFTKSVIIDDEVIAGVEECSPLAPLHNPANLIGVRACLAIMPGVPNIGVFDTAFHQTMEPVAYMYGLPYEYYEKYKVRRYGFHGTSHKYVAKVGAELAGLDFHNSRIITCHIGNGASVTAVLDGKSYDTSMGFSPLDGLVMGTRCGAIDASAITFIGAKEGMSYAELDEMMNKRSGVQGMTDLSSDMRDIDKAYNEGNPRAIVARDMYYNRVKKFVGAYAAEMGGVDLIVFTGGVGENSRELRRSVCAGLEFMGVEFDPAANEVRGEDKILSTPASRVKVAVIATDEELMIATDTYNLVK